MSCEISSCTLCVSSATARRTWETGYIDTQVSRSLTCGKHVSARDLLDSATMTTDTTRACGASPLLIKRGMRVIWKPQWRDKDDDKYTFIAVEDQHPHDGSFGVSTIENTLWIRPIHIGGRADMVESAEPYLPVATLTFMGLTKKGARVQLRRVLGDRELSLTEEVIALSTFRRLFQRFAKDCKVGAELRSGVEFPEACAQEGSKP